jgi:hypothetical protein
MVLLPGAYGNGYAKAPASSSAVLRGAWSASSADAGVLLAQRSYQGGGQNTVASIDGLRRFEQGYNARALLAHSQTSACAGPDDWAACQRQAGHAAHLNWGQESKQHGYGLTYMEISPQFRSDLGWISQTGFRSYSFGGMRRYEDVHPAVGSLELLPALMLVRDWQGQTVRHGGVLSTEVAFNASVWAQLAVSPVSKERLAADGSLFNSRWVQGVLNLSPGVKLSQLTVGLKAGELPDFYNGRPGRGISPSMEVHGTLRPDLGYVLNLLHYRTRAEASAPQGGASLEESAFQAHLNWQYAGFSRWRYVLNLNLRRGQDLSLEQPFRARQRGHSLLWEHAPRTGWRASVALTQTHGDSGRAWESVLKLGHAL